MSINTYRYEYLPITHDEMPVSKVFTIGESVYSYEFHYNERNDFYTVTIKDADDNVLYSTKLVYRGNVVHAEIEGLDVDYDIVPVNLDDLFTPFTIEDQSVNSDNLDTRVRLYLNNAEVI